jgi:4-amino-4-deoxy-L-arabinose transferase-like glycosyltransferase
MSAPFAVVRRRLLAFEQRHPLRAVACLLLIITIAVLSGAYRKPIATPAGCPAAFQIAQNLLQHGTFSRQAAGAAAHVMSERAMPPAYPALIAALALADPRIAEGVDCTGLSMSEHQSGHYFESLRVLQAMAGIGILILVYRLALLLIGVRTVAMASVVLYVIGGKLGEFSRNIEPDNFRNFATFLSLYLLVLAYRTQQRWLFGLAGAGLGVASLFYPILTLLIFAVPLGLIAIQLLAPYATPGRPRHDVRQLGAFALGGLVVVAPWMARNLYLFGDPMLADQSEGLLLSFRVAYNAMPLSDWPIAALSWVPSYGNVIAAYIFGEAAPLRFGLTEHGAYFTDGHAIFAQELAKTAGGENTFFKVWTSHVVADPIRHVLTSIPIFTRGMWGTHGFMGIVGLFLLPRLLRQLIASPNGAAVVAIVAFAFLLIFFQSLVAPDFYWMNTPMLLLMSLAVAHGLPDAVRALYREFGPRETTAVA